MKPWDGIVSEEDQKQTFAAGFGRPGGVGKRPALLIIDVQYRTIGTTPKPFWEAIKNFQLPAARSAGTRCATSRCCSPNFAATTGRCSIPTPPRTTTPPTP